MQTFALGNMIGPASPVDFDLIRENHPWAVNFSNDILLTMLKKNPQFFDIEPNPLFVWGEDPITGKAIPAVGRWSMPVIGIGLAVIALFFVSKMK